ncbi:hypothetical protein HYW75_01390 [Candidatus Pacearchaeota archaeon]|nr:hypothetical protein [Candidatus Pacearchaeota archaeon]
MPSVSIGTTSSEERGSLRVHSVLRDVTDSCTNEMLTLSAVNKCLLSSYTSNLS